MAKRTRTSRARPGGAPAGSPVVVSKLTPPNPPARVLPRRALVRALLDHLEDPLTVVVAEAGYGKTTLLAEAARAAGRPVIWYSLARSDADVMVFTRHLIRAFRGELPRFGRDLARAMDAIGHGGQVAEVLGGVLSNEWAALRGPEYILVLDDFHEVAHAAPLVAMLDAALRIPPKALRVWIASREAPPLALERLRAQGRVFELDSGRLAFTREEVERLFHEVFGRELVPADAERLLEVTRGWPTAIQMVDHAIERSPRSPLGEILAGVGDAPREMRSYLTEEVLSRLAPETTRLLERTVVFDRFDPELAKAVSGVTGTRERLDELTRRGLLRSFGASRSESFGWHELVRHAVRARVVSRDGTGAWAELERDAARLLRERGELEPALAHAIRAGDAAVIAPLVREIAPALLRESRPSALLDALAALPEGLVAEDAELRVHRGDACQALGRWDEAAKDYQGAIDLAHASADRLTLCRALTGFGRVLNRRGAHEQALGVVERALAASDKLPVEIRARLLQTKAGAHFYLGQTSAAIALLDEVRRLLENTPHQDLAAATVHNMALARVAQGRFSEAAQDLRAALAAVKGVGSPRAGLYLANLATVLVELGDLSEARAAAESALESARRFSNPLQETMAEQALAAVLAESGDLDGAMAALRRAEERNAEMRMDLITADLLELRGRIFSARGQFRRAVGFFARAVEVMAKRPDAPRLTAFRAQLAWCELRSGRAQAAKDLLQSTLAAADAGDNEDHRMRVHYWLAEALLATGNAEAARGHLAASLTLVRARGYSHFLRRQARENPAPLILALQRGIELEVCSEALAEAGAAVERALLELLADAPPAIAEAVVSVLAEVGGRAALDRLEGFSPRRRSLAASIRIARGRIEERLQRGRSLETGVDEPPGPVRLTLFGIPALEVAGRRVPASAWRTQRSFHVLCYLALQPRGATREELLEAFWPGRKLASGRRNFHPTLSYLRTVLPSGPVPLLVRDGDVYRLDSDYGMACDLWEFEALEGEARRSRGAEQREHLSRALALADRPLLEGLYEDWADQAQSRMRDRIERAWRELGALEASVGDHEAALRAFRRAAELDAYRETTRVAIVQALVRTGNRAAAVAEAERLRAQVRSELGVDVLPETHQALQEVLAASSAGSTSGRDRSERT